MSVRHVVFALCAFLGGMAGSIVITAGTSFAAKEQSFYTTNFFNEKGKRIGVIGSHPTGEGSFFLFDGKGNIEIMMGAYPSGAEKGQSMIGMHDRANKLRFLMRMHGSKDSPTVIMKDSAGRDKIVFGLDASTEVPYFRYTDQNGRWQDLIK